MNPHMAHSTVFDRIQRFFISALWLSWAAVFALGQHRNHARALKLTGGSCDPGPDLAWHDHALMLWLALGALSVTFWFWRVKPLRAGSFCLASLYLWWTAGVFIGDEARGYAPCTVHGDESMAALGAVLGGPLLLVLIFTVLAGLLAHLAKGLRPK
jgi:hypothetical protein